VLRIPTHDREACAKLDKIIELLSGLQKEIHEMSAQLDKAFADLDTAVAAQTDAETSAITLLNRIAQLIADASAGGDAATVARLTALKDKITTDSASLAAAVVANTPAATPGVNRTQVRKP
jgi:hypothetical protein